MKELLDPEIRNIADNPSIGEEKKGDIGKREEFKNIVEHLLSFADEK